MVSGEKINIIFPVEMMVRELDFRLVLASLWAKPHHRILLAHASHATRLAGKLKGGGLYVGKNMGPTPDNSAAYFKAKENGFHQLHLSEEGAMFMGHEDGWGPDLDLQLDPSMLSSGDGVATWGDVQKDYYLSKSKGVLENIKAVGHPRFDIYKNFRSLYFDEAEAIKNRFCDFILFNSNMGWAVNPIGYSDTFSEYMGYDPMDVTKRLCFVERWSRQMKVFPEFVELLHRLAAKRKDLKFVVRPHPSDSLEDYQHIFRGVGNVHVIREGSVVPWILASKIVLHDGCTTGLEAYLLDKPVVSFTPIQSKQEIYLPNLLGIRANSQEEAENAIESMMGQGAQKVDIPERAHRMLANLRHDSIGKLMRMLDELEANLVPRTSSIHLELLWDQTTAIAVEHTKRVARSLFFENKRRISMATRTLFSGFNQKYLVSRLKQIGDLTGRQLEMRWFSPWLVELRRGES